MGASALDYVGDTIPVRFLKQAIEQPEMFAEAIFKHNDWNFIFWRDYVYNTVKLASAMQQSGVSDGTKVMVVANEEPHFYRVIMAAMLIGAIPVILSVKTSNCFLKKMVANLNPRLAFCPQGYFKNIVRESSEMHSGLNWIIKDEGQIFLETESSHVKSWDDWLSLAEPSDQIAIKSKANYLAGDDPAVILSKENSEELIQIDHQSLAWACDHFLNQFPIVAQDRLVSFSSVSEQSEFFTLFLTQATSGCCIYFCDLSRNFKLALQKAKPTRIMANKDFLVATTKMIENEVNILADIPRRVIKWHLKQKTIAHQYAAFWSKPLARLAKKSLKLLLHKRLGLASIKGFLVINKHGEEQQSSFLSAFALPTYKGVFANKLGGMVFLDDEQSDKAHISEDYRVKLSESGNLQVFAKKFHFSMLEISCSTSDFSMTSPAQRWVELALTGEPENFEAHFLNSKV